MRLAPQIRQTLALLPLSNIELASLIRKELEENPLLEEQKEIPKLEEIEPSEEEKESRPDPIRNEVSNGVNWIEYLEDYDRGEYSPLERKESVSLEKLVTKSPPYQSISSAS